MSQRLSDEYRGELGGSAGMTKRTNVRMQVQSVARSATDRNIGIVTIAVRQQL